MKYIKKFESTDSDRFKFDEDWKISLPLVREELNRVYVKIQYGARLAHLDPVNGMGNQTTFYKRLFYKTEGSFKLVREYWEKKLEYAWGLERFYDEFHPFILDLNNDYSDVSFMWSTVGNDSWVITWYLPFVSNGIDLVSLSNFTQALQRPFKHFGIDDVVYHLNKDKHNEQYDVEAKFPHRDLSK